MQMCPDEEKKAWCEPKHSGILGISLFDKISRNKTCEGQFQITYLFNYYIFFLILQISRLVIAKKSSCANDLLIFMTIQHTTNDP